MGNEASVLALEGRLRDPLVVKHRVAHLVSSQTLHIDLLQKTSVDRLQKAWNSYVCGKLVIAPITVVQLLSTGTVQHAHRPHPRLFKCSHTFVVRVPPKDVF